MALAAALLLAGCSSAQNASQKSSEGAGVSPAPAVNNPLDFALYPGASVVSTRAFTQNVIVPSSQSATIFKSGNGTYSGHEVIAASDASFSDLSSWVDRLADSPPSGYSAVQTGQNPQVQEQAAKYGVDYATFTKKEGAQTHGLLVIVMDPQRVNQRFGTILGMIAKYRALPAVMRAPIDNEAKARTGMSITDATAPDSPIGAALAALDEFEHKSTRGIVLIDAAKH